MIHARFTWQSALLRALIGVLGGFALASCFLVALASALTAAGALPRADAAVTAAMLAFLVWMGAVLLAFAAASLKRALAWSVGAAALFALIGWGCLHG